LLSQEGPNFHKEVTMGSHRWYKAMSHCYKVYDSIYAHTYRITDKRYPKNRIRKYGRRIYIKLLYGVAKCALVMADFCFERGIKPRKYTRRKTQTTGDLVLYFVAALTYLLFLLVLFL
jgi:hypothetical protein